jgi:hypothetical protein
MALTRSFKETVASRVRDDPAFARALLDEAIQLFIDGECGSDSNGVGNSVGNSVGHGNLIKISHSVLHGVVDSFRILVRDGVGVWNSDINRDQFVVIFFVCERDDDGLVERQL